MNATISPLLRSAPSRPLRVAQVAPLMERVPPVGYGGTERVVSVLTETLVRHGHEVTLYATGDSITAARLRAIVPQALRTDPSCENPLPYHLLQIEEVMKEAHAYDVIHFHEPFLNYSAARRCPRATLTTIHGRLDLPDFAALQREFRDLPLVSISYSQRKPMPWAGWVANIYHGYEPSAFTFSPRHSGYLAFIGRLSPEKRPDRAIRIAVRSGRLLKIAAKVDVADRIYFQEVIEPLLRYPSVDFLGEIGDREKQELLGGAQGVLLPIDWPEPFGLTMIEAMACGTPTIAFRAGSVPEVLAHGTTGFIVDTEDEAIAAVDKLESLDRKRIRQEFENRFTAERMVDEYVDVYELLRSSNAWATSA